MQIKWQDAAMLMALAFFIGFLISNNEPKTSSNNNATINEKEIFRICTDHHSACIGKFRVLCQVRLPQQLSSCLERLLMLFQLG